MKTITICGSLKFFNEMNQVRLELEKLGFAVKFPHTAERIIAKEVTYKEISQGKADFSESARREKAWLIKKHFAKVQSCDAILVLNYEKNGIKNYIGGNTLMEMGLAFSLNKDIFLLNPAPEISYKDEIEGMLPIVLENDLNQIKNYWEELPKVYVASESRIKLQAASNGLRTGERKVNILGKKTESKIPGQPIGFKQTLEGAKNRMNNLKSQVEDFELLVSVEAGIIELDVENHFDFNLVLVENSSGKQAFSISSGFKVDEKMYKRIVEEDLELGPLFIKEHGAEEKDPFSVATGGSVNREDVISQAVAVAYLRLINQI